MTDRIQSEIATIQETLPAILQELEEVKERQLPDAPAHRESDRASIQVDYRFTLRHFIDDAMSVVSGAARPASPSIQVSSLNASGSAVTTEYETAPSLFNGEGAITARSNPCTQLLVRSPTTAGTLAIQVQPADLVEDIKKTIQSRIGLPTARFELVHNGRILNAGQSLQRCKIPHNSTLTCGSFRLRTEACAPWVNKILISGATVSSVTVMTLTNITEKKLAFVPYELEIKSNIDPEQFVRHVRETMHLKMKKPLETIRLLFAGTLLEDGKVIYEKSLFPKPGHIKIYLALYLPDPRLCDARQRETHEAPRIRSSGPSKRPHKAILAKLPALKWKAPFGIARSPTRKPYNGDTRVSPVGS